MKEIENKLRRDKERRKGGWNSKITRNNKQTKCPFRAYKN